MSMWYVVDVGKGEREVMCSEYIFCVGLINYLYVLFFFLLYSFVFV